MGWVHRIVLALLVLATPSAWAADCRVGFDVGSSGIRVGESRRPGQARASIDYLGDVWANGTLKDSIDPTIKAFADLPARAGLPSHCRSIAGGYSAWRLALNQGHAFDVAQSLRRIHGESGVALFVIPQSVEGSYAHFAARQQLGSRLVTSHILDVGGGSVQIAGEQGGWGAALGQKAWRVRFCQDIKASPTGQCQVNPVGPDAMAQADRILAAELEKAEAFVGQGISLTAVSAPVVKTMLPVLDNLRGRGLIAGRVDAHGFDRIALEQAIALLGRLDDTAIRALLADCHRCGADFVSSWVTDMLLVQAILARLQVNDLTVAEADLTNVPGLLADPRLIHWEGRFACYLTRLTAQGADAFLSDPESCPF